MVAVYKVRKINRQFPVYKWVFLKFFHVSITGNLKHMLLRNKKKNFHYFFPSEFYVLYNVLIILILQLEFDKQGSIWYIRGKWTTATID